MVSGTGIILAVVKLSNYESSVGFEICQKTGYDL
jgi:hypothetical protein